MMRISFISAFISLLLPANLSAASGITEELVKSCHEAISRVARAPDALYFLSHTEAEVRDATRDEFLGIYWDWQRTEYNQKIRRSPAGLEQHRSNLDRWSEGGWVHFRIGFEVRTLSWKGGVRDITGYCATTHNLTTPDAQEGHIEIDKIYINGISLKEIETLAPIRSVFRTLF